MELILDDNADVFVDIDVITSERALFQGDNIAIVVVKGNFVFGEVNEVFENPDIFPSRVQHH